MKLRSYWEQRIRLFRKLFFLCATIGTVSTGLSGCDDEKPKVSVPVVREVFLQDMPMEEGAVSWSESQVPKLRTATEIIRASAKDSQNKGLLLRTRLSEGAWARTYDLKQAILEYRKQDKPVYCHFDMVGNSGYFFMAQVCDRISMTPAGYLNFVGLALQLQYGREMFENLGINTEFLQVGKYKGAADPFMEKDIPAPVKQSLNALLDSFFETVLEEVSQGRQYALGYNEGEEDSPAKEKDPDDEAEQKDEKPQEEASSTLLTAEMIREVIDEGPFNAEQAKKHRLIDHIEFLSETREVIKKDTEVEKIKKLRLMPKPKEPSLLSILEALGGESEKQTFQGERLGLLTLTGNITDSESVGEDTGSAGPFIRAVKRFEKEDEIKSVVLRIHSPGGSALASDRMWDALMNLAEKKPLIVSVGDMAASGGYYVASAGTRIFAEPLSYVGSIGVVAGKADISELLDKVGIQTRTLTRGKRASWMSLSRAWNKDEKQHLLAMIENSYDRFLLRISEGRDMPVESIQPAAEGRLMSAKQALAHGLVDELGTLHDAIVYAKTQGKLNEDAPIEAWPQEQTLMDYIARQMGGNLSDEETRALMVIAKKLDPHLFSNSILPSLLFSREPIYAGVPFGINIR